MHVVPLWSVTTSIFDANDRFYSLFCNCAHEIGQHSELAAAVPGAIIFRFWPVAWTRGWMRWSSDGSNYTAVIRMLNPRLWRGLVVLVEVFVAGPLSASIWGTLTIISSWAKHLLYPLCSYLSELQNFLKNVHADMIPLLIKRCSSTVQIPVSTKQLKSEMLIAGSFLYWS